MTINKKVLRISRLQLQKPCELMKSVLVGFSYESYKVTNILIITETIKYLLKKGNLGQRLLHEVFFNFSRRRVL